MLTEENAWVQGLRLAPLDHMMNEQRYHTINTINKRTKTIDRRRNIDDTNYTLNER